MRTAYRNFGLTIPLAPMGSGCVLMRIDKSKYKMLPMESFPIIPGQSLVFTSGGHMGYFWDTVYHLENGNFKIAEEGLIKIVDNNGYEVSENEYRYTWNNQVVDNQPMKVS